MAFSFGMSASGMMPPAKSRTSSGLSPRSCRASDHAREELDVGAGEDAEADDVDVFLQRRFGDHLGRLADAGVDHLAAAIAERAGDDLGAAVVAIQPGLRDKHADLVVCHRARLIR